MLLLDRIQLDNDTPNLLPLHPMITPTGWTHYHWMVNHAVIIDPETSRDRIACGAVPPNGYRIKPAARRVDRRSKDSRCKRCLRIMRSLNERPRYRPTRIRGQTLEQRYTYLGWSRGLHKMLAHHLIYIDTEHRKRTACGAPEFDVRIMDALDQYTYACQQCLRTRAFKHLRTRAFAHGERLR